MTRNTAILRDAIVIAIALNAAAALAQHPDGADTARTLDAVTVTGSRISIPGVEASSPVAAIEREEFLTTQPVAVESFLKEFPAMTPSVGLASNYEPGGGSTINMRGLGDNRTLVLVDGRRPIPFNLANVVDTNTIPLSLLQSVEMLTGGASVVYGADAVAGVTNFILRRDFEGVEFNMNWGETKYGDGGRENYEITLGALSDDGRANAVLSIGLSKADPVRQGDRPWSVVALNSIDGTPGGSGTTVPARINIIGAGRGTRQIDLTTNTLVPTYQLYNYNPLNYYQIGLERWQATGLARYEFSRHAEAYGQVNYTRSQVGAAQAPTGLFGVLAAVPLANPYIPGPMRAQICAEMGIAETNCASGRDAAGELIYVGQTAETNRGMSISRRTPELGPRLNNYDTKTFQSTVGVRGALGDHWNYDAYWSYGESDQLQSVVNWGSAAKVRQAMNAISTTECLDPSNGCVPLNPFGPEGSIPQEQLDFWNLNAFAMQKVEQTNAALNLDGDLGTFKSPWAEYPIGVSAGVEYRRTLAGIQSDAAYSSGDVLGLDADTPDNSGGFSIKEVYAESIIPLLSGRTGVENLSLEVGYRHSDFSNSAGFGDTYGSWKYGLTWSPVAPLKFRAMQQRATRAPNISELFMPPRSDVGSLPIDPCQGDFINSVDALTPGTLSWLCVQTGVPLFAVGSVDEPSARQIGTFLGGNPQLSPEEADTTTLGVVWTPGDQLSLTLDWWNIEINGAISRPLEQDVIGGCYSIERNPNRMPNDMCALIERNSLTGGIGAGLAGERGAILPLSNQGFIQKTGIDFGVRVQHALPGALGRMQYALDVSKVTRDDFQAVPMSIVRDCLGYYSTSCIPSHELRSNLRAIWNVGDVAVTVVWRYFSAVDVEPLADAANGPYFAPYRHVPSYSYFDLSAGYNAPWNARISLSVNNLLDKHPPVVGADIGNAHGNEGNTFPQWYDALGRYVSLGVSFRF